MILDSLPKTSNWWTKGFMKSQVFFQSMFADSMREVHGDQMECYPLQFSVHALSEYGVGFGRLRAECVSALTPMGIAPLSRCPSTGLALVKCASDLGHRAAMTVRDSYSKQFDNSSD
jgi:hypothetical protein